jgi:hypothetical protein
MGQLVADVPSGLSLTPPQETKKKEYDCVLFYNILCLNLTFCVLQKACDKLSLPSEYVYYFSLFLIKREEDGDITSEFTEIGRAHV